MCRRCFTEWDFFIRFPQSDKPSALWWQRWISFPPALWLIAVYFSQSSPRCYQCCFFFLLPFLFSFFSPPLIHFFPAFLLLLTRLIIEAHFKHSIFGKISGPLGHHIPPHPFIYSYPAHFLSSLGIFIHVCASKCEEGRTRGEKNKGCNEKMV